jgi:hypothetical protein
VRHGQAAEAGTGVVRAERCREAALRRHLRRPFVQPSLRPEDMSKTYKLHIPCMCSYTSHCVQAWRGAYAALACAIKRQLKHPGTLHSKDAGAVGQLGDCRRSQAEGHPVDRRAGTVSSQDRRQVPLGRHAAVLTRHYGASLVDDSCVEPWVRQIVDEDHAAELLIEHAAQGPVALVSSCITASSVRPAKRAL